MDLSNKNIIHVKKNNIEFLQFKKLLEYSDKINHAIIVGLDKNFRIEKENKNGEKNYKDVCDILNLKYNNIVKCMQKHTDNVKIIYNKVNKDKPDFSIYENTDGLITNKSNLILSTTNADCILLLFYDPKKNVIANVHSGWRGTLKKICINTVNKMIKEYGCNPIDIICCISPSIRKCHFEVDRDVFELFYNEFNDMHDIFEEKNNKYYIDTVLINKTLLEKKGLRKENIIDSEICSVCNKNIIHSYRAEGKNFGLATSLITLL